MEDLFEQLADCSIIIMDGILIGATDYDDAYKLEHVIDRCLEKNVYLRFSKCHLAVEEVEFWGYQLKQGCYGLSDDRKVKVSKLPMPDNQKSAQRVLGVANYFNGHVPNYSDVSGD
jgi:hypothetical protein